MGRLLLNQGLNTAQDRSYLAPGELQRATGTYYRPGDTVRLWKILGRTSYGDAYTASSAGQGIAYFAFDTAGTDRIVVLNADGELHSSVVSATDSTAGTFTTLTTGLQTGSTVLAWAHFNDKWYFSNSKNRPFVLDSSGNLRVAGMDQPAAAPVVSVSGGNYTGRVTTATYTGSEWTSVSNAYDTDVDTEAYSWMRDSDPVGTVKTIIYSAAAADATADRYLVVSWGLKGSSPTYDADGPFSLIYSLNNFRVTTRIWASEDGGSSWTTLLNATYEGVQPQQNLTIPVTANSNLIQVKAEIEQNMAFPSRSAALSLYDIRITDQGYSGVFTTTDGLYYGLAEYNEDDDIEGPLVASSLVTFAGQDAALLTFPTAVNAAATHWKIYRTHDGGVTPGDFRFLDLVPISNGTYLDTFAKDKDFVGGAVPPLLKLQITDSLFQYYASNSPPEAFRAVVEYDNFLVAISEQFPRRIAYSLPGEPEYWPVLYQITDIPLKEHDEMQALAVAGDLLIAGAKEAIIVVNGLAELEAQSFASASCTPLRGAPGCVGPYAMTEFSLAGEPRVVWVSEHGVYQTNGHTVQELSGDLDWGAAVSLGNLQNSWVFYDKADQIIRVGVDTNDDGTVDREYWFHMAEEHRKQNGRPKITGPHYTAIVNLTGGLAADKHYRLYSLDTGATGSVYHEKDGGTDAGNFYNTFSQVPLDVLSPRQYGPNLKEWAVDFPTVRHTSWNTTPLLISWGVGRDEIGGTDTAVTTLTISTQGQTKFVVARSGEWHEVRFQHTGDAGANAALGAIEFDETIMGIQGDTQDS
jgi:hypothetical protein